MTIRSEIEAHQKKLVDINRIILSMKAIASINVQRAQEHIENMRVLNEQVTHCIKDIIGHFPHLELRSEGKSQLCIAFGTDQGLCGTFNESISETIHQMTLDKPQMSYLIIGKRLESYVSSDNIEQIFPSPMDINSLYSMVNELFEYFVHKIDHFKEVILVFNRFMGIGKYKTKLTNLIPIQLSPQNIKGFPPIMDIPSNELLSQIYIEFIYSSIYQAYLESFLAENGVRLLNMNNASQNLKSKLNELELESHYYRQQEITEEIIAVISSYKTIE